MTDAEKRAYQRGYQSGYQCGLRNRWPENRPPEPPNEVVAALQLVLMNFRDEADVICATLDESDELAQRLGPFIDAADTALVALTTWLRTGG